VTDEVSYLAADEEEEHVIAQANAAVDDRGNFTEERVLVRRGPQGTGVRMGAVNTSYGTTSEIDFVPPSEVDLMDVSPKQIVSVSTALIPFVEHDDANRALMGANMQKQAVPLVVPEAPYIGTGVEARAARDAGDVLIAEGEGTVTEISGDTVTVEYRPGPEGPARHDAGTQGLPPLQVPPLQPEHLHQPPHPGGRGAESGRRRSHRRRPFHPQR
jgi:DNA-directed RNA polymerase subunit beta